MPARPPPAWPSTSGRSCALGVRRPAPRLPWELEQPGTRRLVEPFPEVPGVLERPRAAGVDMAIVSDNWPGLEGLCRQLGLPPRSAFVDDAPDLVAAAIGLGRALAGTARPASSGMPQAQYRACWPIAR